MIKNYKEFVDSNNEVSEDLNFNSVSNMMNVVAEYNILCNTIKNYLGIDGDITAIDDQDDNFTVFYNEDGRVQKQQVNPAEIYKRMRESM